MTKEIVNILIVEDEFFVAMDLEELLMQSAQYRVSVAQSVEDARTKLLSQKVALAIFDINLSGRSSLELIKKASSSGTKTIIVSGSRVSDDLIENTGSIYFPKPCNVDELLDAIELLTSAAQVPEQTHELPKPPAWLDHLKS